MRYVFVIKIPVFSFLSHNNLEERFGTGTYGTVLNKRTTEYSLDIQSCHDLLDKRHVPTLATSVAEPEPELEPPEPYYVDPRKTGTGTVSLL
jgi:hypothetical protein